MERWLLKTAWPMAVPAPYSAFHICFTAAGIVLAALLACFLAHRQKQQNSTFLIFFCGILLSASELYKQLFLYYIVNSHQYDWWYFPFQLCSLPMYLCLLYPLFPPSFQKAACTFLQDFGLLGGIMALAEPSGLLHPYWTLTLHGLLWHILLVFIGLFIAFSQKSDLTKNGYKKVLELFALFTLAATIINIILHPLGTINMFYISPYYPCPQLVFSKISQILGILPGNLIYLGSICIGGFLIHRIITWLIPIAKN